jgi:hypothetical protein
MSSFSSAQPINTSNMMIIKPLSFIIKEQALEEEH